MLGIPFIYFKFIFNYFSSKINEIISWIKASTISTTIFSRSNKDKKYNKLYSIIKIISIMRCPINDKLSRDFSQHVLFFISQLTEHSNVLFRNIQLKCPSFLDSLPQSCISFWSQLSQSCLNIKYLHYLIFWKYR